MKYLLLLFIPLAIYLFVNNPTTIFVLSWASSLALVYLSTTGKITPLPTDRPWAQQLFRPFIFSQILFFGYNSIANIFFFLDTLGYEYFEKTNLPIDYPLIEKLALIQLYVLVAHTAYLCGLLPAIKNYSNQSQPYRIKFKQSSYLIYAIILFLLSYVLKSSPLAFFAYYVNSLGLFLALFYCVNSLKNKTHIPVALGVLVYLMANALLTGMKENIIIILAFLMTNLFGLYKWKPIVLLSPFILIFLYYYPTVNNNYRKLAWDEQVVAYDAATEVLKEENIKDLTIAENNWGFLTTRLSEVSMAVSYFDYVPTRHDYYGFSIVADGLKLLLPRILFPDKGSPDISAMKRATDAGAIQLNENDYTSAKPQTLPDAYMSGGLIGVLITFFVFGWATTRISLWSEKLFAGYEFGSILIFQSFFSVLNKGGCFENIIGSLFWSVILVMLLHLFLKSKGVIVNK